MDLVGIPSQYLDVVWNDVKHRIGDVIARFSDDEMTLEMVEKEIKSMDAQLWTTSDRDSIYITKIFKKSDYSELFLWMFHADELKEDHWRLLEYIKMWAKEQGCTKSRAIVRPGFEKLLVKHGWEKRHVTMTQEI